MSLVILEVDMGRRERKIAKDLIKKIPGVVDVDVHETGHVAIIGTADTATLKEKLEATLRRPVVVLADHRRAAPAPPHTYGYDAMPPPSGAAYRRTPFGGIPSQDEPAVFGVNMDVHCPRSKKAPAPPLGGRYGMVPPPSFAFPPPMAMMGHPYGPLPAPYNPYGGYHQPRYATPSPEAGYYYTSFGPSYMPNDALEDCFEDEHHNGCCCSIQ